MRIHTKIALALLVCGSIAIFGGKALLTYLEDKQSIAVSDAKLSKGKIVIGIDNWIGYFPLCSPVMQRRLYQQGYLLECVEDKADYGQRIESLANGSLDLAVATVDSYLVNGGSTKFPGAIIAVLDESKGGDALVAWTDKIDSLDTLRQSDDFKIAFTPDSPSDHLLKAVAVHFDIARLKQRRQWPVLTEGSEDALQRLLDRQVDAAVLWEPDVSKALRQQGIKTLLSSGQTQRLIVDVLIAARKLIGNKPELLEVLLSEYFQTLKYYRDHGDDLIADVEKATGLPEKDVKALLKGVQWQTLNDNAELWFGTVARHGIPQQELVETIKGSIDILREYGTFRGSPLPENDPYRIINSRFAAEVHQQLGLPIEPLTTESNAFPALTEQQWRNLQPVGMLKIRPLIFASGTGSLTLDDKKQLDDAALTLKHYPNFRILVKGHTSIRGDRLMNKQLSQDRAEAVARYLMITHDIPAARIKAIGFGGEQPLPRIDGESNRAYNYRLPRVELALVGEKL
ncbi:MAG: phosphate ABC transporter substrate-binding/OmpA family protein [Gammaproteobacteria bacterium]